MCGSRKVTGSRTHKPCPPAPFPPVSKSRPMPLDNVTLQNTTTGTAVLELNRNSNPSEQFHLLTRPRKVMSPGLEHGNLGRCGSYSRNLAHVAWALSHLLLSPAPPACGVRGVGCGPQSAAASPGVDPGKKPPCAIPLVT
jgi:hypothetical protein